MSYLGKQPLAYHYPEDLNDRELHDAETLMALACNIGQTAILEIGTSTGLTTLGFSRNAPNATVRSSGRKGGKAHHTYPES